MPLSFKMPRAFHAIIFIMLMLRHYAAFRYAYIAITRCHDMLPAFHFAACRHYFTPLRCRYFHYADEAAAAATAFELTAMPPPI